MDGIFKPQDENYWKNRSKDDSKRDWNEHSDNWIKDYNLSVDHPHRESILNLIAMSGARSVLEIGCNSGPNLIRISRQLPGIKIGGIDINAASIEEAKNNLPWLKDLYVASATKLPFPDRSFEVIVCDAILMYLDPESMNKAMHEMRRVASIALIFCEWHDSDSTTGVIKDYHWSRNYAQLMMDFGYNNILSKKLTKKEWPSPNWEKNGWLYAGSVVQ